MKLIKVHVEFCYIDFTHIPGQSRNQGVNILWSGWRQCSTLFYSMKLANFWWLFEYVKHLWSESSVVSMCSSVNSLTSSSAGDNILDKKNQ